MVIEFGLDEQPYSEWYDNLHEPPASGLTAAIVGLQVGVVSSIEDPKGEFRVLVKMPILGTEEAVWARLGVLDAGNKRGAYFMPEVGDEVIMGFIGNDARQAVILGSLHSSGKHPTPLSPKKENHEKGFVSRSGLRFLFNDDKKSVIIETPEGNRLSITEKDKNKIKIEDKDGSIIEMTGEGITIESAGNLTLKAKKNIVIEGQKLSLKGKISGSFDGGTSLKLSGGMIDIN
jgi:uncharacterized protein involved in type VI secretion and phage assembly